MPQTQPVTEGRIAHYVKRAPADGQPIRCQAAVVVRSWGPETVNLQVIRDGSNDHRYDGHGDAPISWATSASYVPPTEDQGHGHHWHWPTDPHNDPQV